LFFLVIFHGVLSVVLGLTVTYLGSMSLMRPSSLSPLGTNGIAPFSSIIGSENTTLPVNESKFASEVGAEHPFFKAKKEINPENSLSRNESPPPPERQPQSKLVIGGSGTSKQCEVSKVI